MSALPDLQQALDYYRQQYDEIGSRLLRLQQELTQARRDARRNRTIALIVQRLYESAHQATSPEPLGETLIALLVESLRVDCAALLRWQKETNRCQIEHRLGLSAEFILPLCEAPPIRAASLHPETLPIATQAVLHAEGLRTWLWIAVPTTGQILLLGNRQLHKLESDLVFEEADQVIAAAALKVYLSLLEQQETIQALRVAETN